MGRNSRKNSRNINLRVHYFIAGAFNYVSGLFFSRPLEVKLCKAYLAIKHCPSLTLFFLPFSTHTSLALFLFHRPSLRLLVPPSFSCPAHVFLSGWPSQRGYRVLTCLHLPPALADQWGRCVESPSFNARPFSASQLMLSVFTTSDPRPWQQWQECQE